MADISDRIRELRRAQNMTQDELAQKLKVTRSAIGMYEQGVRRPDFAHMDALADQFNVSLDYLLGHTDVNTGYPRHDAMIESTKGDKSAADRRMLAYSAALVAAFTAAAPEIQQAVKKLLDMKD